MPKPNRYSDMLKKTSVDDDIEETGGNAGQLSQDDDSEASEAVVPAIKPAKQAKESKPKGKAAKEPQSAVSAKTAKVTISVPIDFDMAFKELKYVRKMRKNQKVTADELYLEALKAFEKANPEFASCLKVARDRIKLYS